MSLTNKRLQLYKDLFNQSFFFDKYFCKNAFQFPKICSLNLKINSPANKIQFSKLILLFYILTGQCPKLSMRDHTLKSNTRKKVVKGLTLTLHQYGCFLDYLIRRQLGLLNLNQQPFLLQDKSTITFTVAQDVQDDDVLFQVLKVIEKLQYQVCLKSNSLERRYWHSLLLGFKIPCKIL